MASIPESLSLKSEGIKVKLCIDTKIDKEMSSSNVQYVEKEIGFYCTHLAVEYEFARMSQLSEVQVLHYSNNELNFCRIL